MVAELENRVAQSQGITPSATEAKTKIQALFQEPIIDEIAHNQQIICSWQPNTQGWIGVADDALVISGPSRFSFLEKSLSAMPLFGPILIKTFFETIRQKERRMPFQSIAKIVAATRPRRTSFWDGGQTECGIIHILIEESGRPHEVCAFSQRESFLQASGKNFDLRDFWKICTLRLGATKLDIRDEQMSNVLLSPERGAEK